MMDAETVDLAIKGAVGLVVSVSVMRQLKAIDLLKDEVTKMNASIAKIIVNQERSDEHQQINEKRWGKTFKRFDNLIEMLRARDHYFDGILHKIRWEGEKKNGWEFKEPWNLPRYEEKHDVDGDNE